MKKHKLARTMFGTASLGDLLRVLESIPFVDDDGEHEPKPVTVHFDFGGLAPTTLASYRGFYDHLAIGFDAQYPYPTLESFVGLLRGAIGTVYGGWKGGAFKMSERTPIWVANRGYATSTAITGVWVDCSYVILRTTYVSL